VSAAEARKAFPTGTSVNVDESSWAPDGTGTGGTMLITLAAPGRQPVSYVAIMVKEQQGWKVLATVPLKETTAAGKP
jgi:hypothetical protein